MNSGVVIVASLELGCISRSYRRLEISLPGRCSLNLDLSRVSHRASYASPVTLLPLASPPGSKEHRRKMLSVSILFRYEKLCRPRSSLRVMVNTSRRVSNCAPGIRIMFLNFGVSRSRMLLARIVGRRSE